MKRIIAIAACCSLFTVEASAAQDVCPAAFQQWLTGESTALTELSQADMDGNGVLNVFDLCLMKRTSQAKPTGRLLFHSYSEYTAGDSRLMLYDFSEEKLTVIESDVFYNAMNGDFGADGNDIVFMAITRSADAWDIYRYNAVTGAFTNLTENSGFRNEDPKFSPDGERVVFKRGRWDSNADGFVYDLMELHLSGGAVTPLTDTPDEESMPYYSSDGTEVYYAKGAGETSGIYALDTATGENRMVYDREGVQEYYPVAFEDEIYCAGWYGETNRNDALYKVNPGGEVQRLPLSDGTFNVSDPCPMGKSRLIYSSTENGSYDLYFHDGINPQPLSFLNTENRELGAAYFE